jgi:hypothetical protein
VPFTPGAGSGDGGVQQPLQPIAPVHVVPFGEQQYFWVPPVPLQVAGAQQSVLLVQVLATSAS